MPLQRGPVFADGDRRCAARKRARHRGRFNGAPSSQTGIAGLRALGRRAHAPASTGPRLRRRGSVLPSIQTPQVPMLQRGPVFADGDRSPTPRPPRCRRSASTGPRLRRRGSRVGGGRVGAGALASTGPRLRRRGSLRHQVDSIVVASASTGPRLRRRGSARGDGRGARRREASTGPRLRRRGSAPGRAPGRAIGRAASTGPRLRRRGSGRGDASDGAVQGASTGPRLRRRGSQRGPSSTCLRARSFNGAPSSQTGIGRGSRWGSPPPRSCFNGAPSSQTGIVRKGATTSSSPFGLQRGPVFADGDRSKRSGSVALVIVLQRGPVFADGDRRVPGARETRRLPGFNGAPSSQTGIANRSAGLAPHVDAGFNGAPSSQTGIARQRRNRRGAQHAAASTGPRLRRRGSAAVIDPTFVAPLLLQRGPVFADGDRSAWRSPAARL